MEPQEQQDNSAASAESKSDEFFQHLGGAMDAITNARWDDATFHLDKMDEIRKEGAPSEKQMFDTFSELARNFAEGSRLFTAGKSNEEKEKALELLVKARDVGRDLVKLDKNFASFALSVETPISILQEKMARARGDAAAADLIVQQREQLVQRMIDNMAPDDQMRSYFEGMKLFQTAVAGFVRGMQRLVEMDLDSAQSYLEESARTVIAMRDYLSKVKAETLLLEAGRNSAEAFGLLISGQEAYVRVLRAAIIGDVTRSDVTALENAERGVHQGLDLLTNASQVMPGLLDGQSLVQTVTLQANLIRNLRSLCERSLTPKAITATTAPKVIFYFAGTLVVLLIGLPTSGLVAHLQSTDLGLLLIVSLVVSVIAAFGFEATRLVPLFDVFSRMLPWGGKSGNTQPKAS